MADKRISQLNSHTTPSGSDLLVIVNNNETKKITYADLKDSIVINSDNALLNAFSASYLNDSASFHTRINAATNEQSLTHLVTTSSFNIVSASIDGRVDSLESWSSSLDSTFATDLQVSIVSSSVAATIGIISQNTGLVTTSSFNEYTASISTASLVSRLNDLESHTGSYLTSLNGTISGSSQLTGSYDSRYVLSGSITQTTWDNISGKPTGLVSQSTDITSLNAFTASYFTYSASIDSRITTEQGRVDAILSAVTADKDSFAEIVSLINSVDTTNDNTFATYYTSSNARIGSLESVTSSYETKGSGIVSGSSQLTASYDTRYTLSGSSITINTGSLVTTSSFNAFTASVLTTGSNTFNGNQIISGGLYVTSIATISSSFELPSGSSLMILSGSNIYVDASGSITGSLSGSVFGIGDVSTFSSSVDIRIKNIVSTPAGTISGSSQLTASYDTRYTLSGSVQPLPNGLVSSSIQVLGGSGVISSSAQLPSGLISGSSQLTASYDTRYTLSGSVVSGTTPAGTISGSAQISAFGFVSGSYTTTSSFNSFTASAQTVTTGSNSFNGTQTITGSLIITTGSFVGSQLLANTSSLYLTSGSNLYVQNNALVEITGSLVVSGSVNIITSSPLQIGTGSGDEGGEILLAKAATNSTLSGSGITIDSYRDRLRIFEQGGDARGVYIDLSKAPIGVSGELTWKASGFVNAGTYVTLDNLKATLTSSGNRGLSIAAVSSNFTATYAGTFNNTGGAGGNSSNGTISVTTTPTTSLFGWNFAGQGDLSTFVLSDITNNRAYRITLQIGGSYLNNFIMIERLH